jgi:tRNA threonylcarbamoyladenosine biosynthesis protein TsaB
VALLLAFDTATKHCAVVLAENGRVLAERVDGSDRLSHAEVLNVFIDAVMKDAGRGLDELNGVAVGTGPGSYTGLRIGLSAAKGLCFGLDIPIFGMPTLEVLVHELIATGQSLEAGQRLHPMVDARRMEVYTATYHHGTSATTGTAPLILDEPWCASRDPQFQHVVFGDGADKAAELFAGTSWITHIPGIRPSSAGLAACAHKYYISGKPSDLAYLVPEYGKEANVAQPKRMR